MFVAKNEEMVPVAKTRALYAPNTHFRNGWRATTKLRETTPNMSFGPKVVDWASSLRKTKKWFLWQKLVLCMHPTPVFGMGDVWLGLTMGYKFCTIRFKDRIGLGSGSIAIHFWTIIYLGLWHFVKNHLDQIHYHPYVRQRNCAKPPQTWVLDLK